MTQTQVPPFEDTKKRILASGKTEAWLTEALKKKDEDYGGSIKDLAFKAWLVAQDNNIEVGQIKVANASEMGPPLNLCDATREKCRREMEADKNDRTLFSVEGVVVNFREGETSKGGPKVSFTLVDPTGRCTVTAYGEEAVGKVINARVKDGDVVRIPKAGFFAPNMEKDDFWFTLTIPPFGDVERTDKSADDVFKNIEIDAAKDGDPVYAIGLVTHLQKRENDACASCTRWVRDDAPDEHDDCKDKTVVKQVSYEGTLVTGSGQTYPIRFNHRFGKPDIVLCKDRVKVRGFWTKRGSIAVSSLAVVGKPSSQPSAAPVESSTKPAAATAPKTDAGSTPASPPEVATVDIPKEVLDHFRSLTVDFGGKNRAMILVNNTVKGGIVKPTDAESALSESEQENALKNRVQSYLELAIQKGLLKYADEERRYVEWVAKA